MTPQQHVSLTLQQLASPAEAFALWPALEQAFPGCSLMLASNEAQAFKIPAHRTAGRAHVLSGLAADGIFFLNSRIFQEMNSGRAASFPVDYCISFDTNVASFLRSLFAGKREPVHADLLALLQSFQGNRLNWDMDPYLWENADQIKLGHYPQKVFETAMASERLDALDKGYFLNSGDFRFNVPEPQMEAAARAYLDSFAKLSASTWGRDMDRPRLAIHAGVLKLALLHIERPDTNAGAQKTMELLRFMDEELAGMFALLATLAVERFSGGRRAGILDRLQSGAKNLVKNARNIAWDLFHYQSLYQQASFRTHRSEFLVPCFLTFDQDLAALFQLYPMKACLVPAERGPLPQLFPAVALESLLRNAGCDDSFLNTYFTPQASQRRRNRLHAQPPDCKQLVSRLEAQLAKYDPASS